MDTTSLSLLRRVRANDEHAWGRLVHIYGPLVHRWCKRARLDDQDTADVFQETFRSVLASLANFKPARSVGSFRSWLRTIVRTRIADHYRRRGKSPIAEGGTTAQRKLANVPDPLGMEQEEDEEANDDNAIVIHRAMDVIREEFSAHNWNAFLEVAVHGKPAAEVARSLGLNPQAVRQANYRIRKRLRVILQDLVDLPDDPQ